MNILELANFNLETVLFTFFRTSGLFLIAPMFSQKGIPHHVKIMFALTLSMVLSPIVQQQGFIVPLHLVDVLSLAAREMLVGVLIGFVFYSLFVGVQMAGAFVGFQAGFAIVNVIDPTTSQQVSILAQFKFIIAMLIFLMLDGHHMMLRALASSYQLIPLGEAMFRFSVTEDIARLVTGIFILAIKLAAPVMATLVLTDVGLGVISRTVPQMNIFIVGFPIKIALCLFFTGTALPIFGYVFSKALRVVDQESLTLLTHLAR